MRTTPKKQSLKEKWGLFSWQKWVEKELDESIGEIDDIKEEIDDIKEELSVATSNLEEVMPGLDVVVKVGEIDFEDLNAADTDTDIDFVFAAAKPEGKELECLYFKNTERLTTVVIPPEEGEPDPDDQTNKILSISNKDNAVISNISELGICSPEITETDITVTVKLEIANAQDWATGKIEVYARLRNYVLV